MKKTFLIASTILLIAALVVTVMIVNNESTALSEKLKAVENELAMTNEKLEKTEEVLDEADKKIANMTKWLEDKNQLNYERDNYWLALRDVLGYSLNNLFMGKWEIAYVSDKGGQESEELVNELTEKFQSQILELGNSGFYFLGCYYDRFEYSTSFINIKKQYGGLEIPFKIDGQETDYMYQASITGYEFTEKGYAGYIRREFIGYIILEDENNAYLTHLVEGDHPIYLKLERVGEITESE